MLSFNIYPLLFRTRGGSYVYDPLTNKVISVSAKLFNDLFLQLNVDERERGRIWQHPTLSGDSQAELSSYREVGDLVAKEITLESFPTSKAVRDWQSRPWVAPSHLIVEITDACNLRCRYCAFNGNVEYHRQRGTNVWDLNALKSLIRWYLKSSNPVKERTISFYGGEPLLYPTLLQRTADYANSICTGPAQLRFQLTTNGTLLTLQLAKELFSQNFTLGVSFDGAEETHDWSRKDAEGRGTFRQVIANLKRIWEYFEGDLRGRIFISATLDGSTRGVDLLGWIRLLEEEPFLRSITKRFAGVSDPIPTAYQPRIVGDNQDAIVRVYDLYQADIIQGHKDELGFFTYVFDPDIMTIHGRAIERLHYHSVVGGMCVPGSLRALASLDGNFYPCEKVDSRFSLGKTESGIDPKLVQSATKRWTDMVLENCKGCWALRFCSPCAGIVSGTADVQTRFQAFCSNNRYKWAMCLALYYRMLEIQPDCWSVLPIKQTAS